MPIREKEPAAHVQRLVTYGRLGELQTGFEEMDSVAEAQWASVVRSDASDDRLIIVAMAVRDAAL